MISAIHRCALAIAMATAWLLVGPALATNYCVRVDGSDAAAGTDWTTALQTVTNALTRAGAGDQIWVAEGVYTPGADRTNSFRLKGNVALYGGFSNGMASLGERDWAAHPTILSGEIGDPATNSDNSYHIVMGANVANAILDGFVISNGNANGTSPDCDGGGLYLNFAYPFWLNNCTFIGNAAATNGGGMFADSYSQALVSNCRVVGNSCSYRGGGMYFGGSNEGIPAMSNCTFVGNTSTGAAANGAGLCLINVLTMPVDGCVFSNNHIDVDISGVNGGGLMIAGTPRVRNCQFYTNRVGTASNGRGAAIYSGSSPLVTNCLFKDNVSYGGGAVDQTAGGTMSLLACTFTNNYGYAGGGMNAAGGLIASNCLFVANRASLRGGGAAIWNSASLPTRIDGCTFLNNSCAGAGYGGAIWAYNVTYPTGLIANCVFVNNTCTNTGGHGGTIELENFALTMQNCAFVTNGAASGGGIYCESTTAPILVSNCTFYGNYGGAGGGVYVRAGYPSCPAIRNSILWGNTAPNVYNGSSGTITNSYSDIQGCGTSTNWHSSFGADAGGNLDVDPVFVDPANYDVHLQSPRGHWTPEGWVADLQLSPCIDKGDPADDYSQEPLPNGERINMGAYGGTPQASKSWLAYAGTLLSVY